MRKLIELFDAVSDCYDRTDFKPNPDGSTHCNQAVHAIASTAFTYNGFRGLIADDMIDIMQGDDWAVINMEQAQDYANNGSLVVAALKSTDMGEKHGHVCVVRPGIECDSGKWGKVPRCLQIGASDFIARAQSGPLTNMAVGVNESFKQMPKFYVLRSSL